MGGHPQFVKISYLSCLKNHKARIWTLNQLLPKLLLETFLKLFGNNKFFVGPKLAPFTCYQLFIEFVEEIQKNIHHTWE